jgi:hypothetical protein
MHRLLPTLICLAVFHSPDGKEIRIDSHHIVAVRPADTVKGHLHEGIQTVIYTPGQNFGVTEPLGIVEEVLSECVD